LLRLLGWSFICLKSRSEETGDGLLDLRDLEFCSAKMQNFFIDVREPWYL
jgi:hypothetical protein